MDDRRLSRRQAVKIAGSAAILSPLAVGSASAENDLEYVHEDHIVNGEFLIPAREWFTVRGRIPLEETDVSPGDEILLTFQGESGVSNPYFKRYTTAVDEEGRWEFEGRFQGAKAGFTLYAQKRRQSNAIIQVSGRFIPDPDPRFDVTLEETPREVVAGETLELSVDIENQGIVPDEKIVELKAGDLGSDQQSVSLGVGNASTETFSIQTEMTDTGEQTAVVDSAQDSASTTVTVSQPATFLVTHTETKEPAAGEQLELTVIVRNDGDIGGETTLVIGAEELGSTEVLVDLDPGESDVFSVPLQTDEGDAGDYDITFDSGDDTATTSATVLEPTDENNDSNQTDDEDEPTDDSTDGESDEDGGGVSNEDDGTENTDDDGPGFTLGGAVGSLAGVGYLLRKRLDDEDVTK